MSVAAITRYSFRIEPTNIPAGLRDVTLPVEIFGPDDRRQWAALVLREAASTVVEVEQPGKHDVRVELPSGRRLRFAVQVSSEPNALESVRFDLGVLGRRRKILWGSSAAAPPPLAVYKRAPGQALVRITDGASPWFRRILRRSREPLIECAGRLVEGWKTSPRDAPEDLQLTLQGVSRSFAVPPGRETRLVEDHPGWSPDSRRCRPLYLHVRRPALATGDSSGDALIVLPPVSRFPIVHFLLDPDPHPDPTAPHLLAYVESVRPAADALFTYVRGGSFEAARHAQATVKLQAEDLLYGKEASPVCAMVAAYALYRLGDRDRLEWVRNLADWFSLMPDGAVIYGAHMIQQARPEEAWKYFKVALDRGIPMYSEGVKLLCDGLVLLRTFLAKEPEVRAYATRAYSLAALANMDSELTCLRPDSGLPKILDRTAPW